MNDLLVLKNPIRGCSSAGGVGDDEDPLVAEAAQLATFDAMGLLVFIRCGDLEADLKKGKKSENRYYTI